MAVILSRISRCLYEYWLEIYDWNGKKHERRCDGTFSCSFDERHYLHPSETYKPILKLTRTKSDPDNQ